MRIIGTLGIAVMTTLATGLTTVPAIAAQSPPGRGPGATLVADLLPGAGAGDPQQLTAVGGMLYFTAVDGEHGRELWRSDGSSAGTRRLTDLAPGRDNSDPTELTAVNGRLFFSAWQPSTGRELWSSDGTPAGTQLTKDIVPGPGSSTPQHVTYGVKPRSDAPSAQTLAYFSADDGTRGRELWRSDGTNAGTSLVADINPGAASSNPTGFGVLPGTGQQPGTTAMFAADDGTRGRELWRSDGTNAGTALQADINPGAAGSAPTSITGSVAFYGLLGSFAIAYLSADDGTHGREPYTTFLNGRTTVIDVRPGPEGSNPTGFAPFAFAFIAINADDGTRGREPYYLRPGSPRPDGKDSATLIADLNPGAGSSSQAAPVYQHSVGRGRLAGPQPPYAGFGRGYLPAGAANDDPRLYKLDVETYGPYSQAGTHGVSIIEPTVIPSKATSPGRPVLAGSTAVYAATLAGHGRELWRSGGHQTNTAEIRDIRPGSAGSDPRDVTVVGERVYFTADDGRRGRELWTAVVGRANNMNLDGPSQPTSTTPSTFTLQVSAAPAAAGPTGTITIWEGANAVATVGLPAGQTSTTWTTTLSPGAHRLTATYSGDRNYAPSTSVPWTITLP